MPTSLSVSPLRMQLGWSYTDSTSTGGTTSNSESFHYSKTLANGTGAGAAQRLYFSKLTITTGATTTLDINATTGTPIKDVFQNNIIITKLKVIYVEYVTTTTTGTLEVSGSALTGTTGSPPILMGGTTPTARIIIRPTGAFMLACTDATGYPVTDATGDTVTIKNNDAASVDVNVCLIGE